MFYILETMIDFSYQMSELWLIDWHEVKRRCDNQYSFNMHQLDAT